MTSNGTTDDDNASSSSNVVAAAAIPLVGSHESPAVAMEVAAAAAAASGGSTEEQPVDDDAMANKAPWWKFQNNAMSQGYAILGTGRGALVMSNIFLSTAFIQLASRQAGCVDENNELLSDDDDCDGTVYGMKPGALIANIAVISGVLSALFMPLFGAMIDCTNYRRAIGIWTVIVMLVIQALQVWLTDRTWFAMAVLQAVAGFIYQIQVLCVYAYLPDMARAVGEAAMTSFTATFVMLQFGAQSLYLILIIVVSVALGISDDDVKTARYSQGINVVWVSIAFYLGWKRLPSITARQKLDPGRTLVSQGFVQVWHTVQKLNRDFRKGLRWYFLGLIFAEAAVNSFTVVSVVYLDDHIGLTGQQIAIFFLITLISSLPGSRLGAYITHKTNPSQSYRLVLVCLIVTTICGSLLVDYTIKYVAYAWAVVTGVFLGWFYPVENLYFSMALPKDQEAEFSGFFVYSTQILGWAPPLLFAGLVSADVSQTYGVMSIAVFCVVAIGLLSCAASWPEILEEAKVNDHQNTDNDTTKPQQQQISSSLPHDVGTTERTNAENV